MKRLLVFTLSGGLLFTGCTLVPKDSPSARHFAKGFKAYQDGDFETAALYLKPLADSDYPAAQMLLARMYANGQGVGENMEKSEELRNKAALRMYSQMKLTPGQMDPTSENLSMLEKRVNYYVNGLENGDAPPSEAPAQPATPEPTAATEPATSSKPVSNASVEPPIDLAHMAALSDEMNDDAILSTSRISLTNLLIEASSGKKEAARQIAEAYKKGLYGIKPDPVQAALWEKKS